MTAQPSYPGRAEPCVEHSARFGFGELLIVGLPVVVVFVFVYLAGKGAGFKQGLREAEKLRNAPR